MAEITQKSARKEWRRPELRKLPIAATADGGQEGKDPGNEGGGQGKGDAGPQAFS